MKIEKLPFEGQPQKEKTVKSMKNDEELKSKMSSAKKC